MENLCVIADSTYICYASIMVPDLAQPRHHPWKYLPKTEKKLAQLEKLCRSIFKKALGRVRIIPEHKQYTQTASSDTLTSWFHGADTKYLSYSSKEGVSLPQTWTEDGMTEKKANSAMVTAKNVLPTTGKKYISTPLFDGFNVKMKCASGCRHGSSPASTGRPV